MKMIAAKENYIDWILEWHRCPLNVNDQQGAEGGPEAVGAVADGVAQSEIFPEGEDGDDGGGDGDNGGGGEEDETDDDGNENEGSEDACQGHLEKGYQMTGKDIRDQKAGGKEGLQSSGITERCGGPTGVEMAV